MYIKFLVHDASAAGIMFAENMHPTVLQVFIVVFACIDRHEQVFVQSWLSAMFTAVG